MFKGSITALVTPFAEDGGLDLKRLEALVEWQIAEGSHGLVPTGTTGESPTLSHEEHREVIETVVRVAAGRVPVIPGTGSNATAEAIGLTQHAQEVGADAAQRQLLLFELRFFHQPVDGAPEKLRVRSALVVSARPQPDMIASDLRNTSLFHTVENQQGLVLQPVHQGIAAIGFQVDLP